MSAAAFDKVLVVTRQTRLAQLIERFNTRAQARFYITHAGGDFADYEREDDAYRACLDRVQTVVSRRLPVHRVDRTLMPTLMVASTDLVVTVGQDGLVANCAKYVGRQPLVAVNPDPARFDGVLLPFDADSVAGAIDRVISGSARVRNVTLAEAVLNDGQRLLAFNDLFVGARTHVSARYRLTYGISTEAQSSSGVIVSTGAGSTGWLSSVFNMARNVQQFAGGTTMSVDPVRMAWDEPRLAFAVREPFVSRHSSAGLGAGFVDGEHPLTLESLMPTGGVIFSDGVEADFVTFDAGATARVRCADNPARLVVT